MKFSLIFLVLVLSSVCADFKHKKSQKWLKHSKKYNLVFKNDEHQEKHFEYFDKKDEIIEKHNSNPNAQFRMGHNDLSHLSPEHINRLCGRKAVNNTIKGDFQGHEYMSENGIPFKLYSATPGYKLPESFDWVQQGWNPVVKNQSPCGDCWAHSITSAIEFQIWKKTRKTVTISRQELNDCSKSFGNMGCSGGVEQWGLDYVIKNKINTEAAYPFTSGTGGKYENTEGVCQANTGKQKYSISKYAVTSPNDEKILMEVLHKYGPVAIGIEGTTAPFQNYKSGIYDSCNKFTNHAVLLVGYGTENGKKFWNILNSWGTSFGQNGFIKVTRDNDKCGIVEASAIVPLDVQ